jgi:hypothetical protein
VLQARVDQFEEWSAAEKPKARARANGAKKEAASPNAVNAIEGSARNAG